MGTLYFSRDEYDLGQKCFEKCVELNPLEYTYYNKLGACYTNNNEREKSLEYLHKGYELNVSYVKLIVNMGIAYHGLKNYEEAMKWFVTALTLNNKVDEIWGYMESLQFITGHFYIFNINVNS